MAGQSFDQTGPIDTLVDFDQLIEAQNTGGITGAPTWPAGLPQQFDLEGYHEVPPALAQRTPMAWGPAKARPMVSIGPRMIAGTMTVLDTALSDQITVFEQFYYQSIRAGELSFNWAVSRPRIVSGLSTFPVMVHKFLKEPTIKTLDGGDSWLLGLEMMILPTSAVAFGTPGSLTWPAALPQTIMITNYEETLSMKVIRSKDFGKHQKGLARRTHGYDVKPLKGTIELLVDPSLNLDQVEILDQFYASTAGCLRFNWGRSRPVLAGTSGDYDSMTSIGTDFDSGSAGTTDFDSSSLSSGTQTYGFPAAVMRFTGPPVYHNIGGTLWEADLSLEIL